MNEGKQKFVPEIIGILGCILLLGLQLAFPAPAKKPEGGSVLPRSETQEESVKKVQHVATPEFVKGIYLSAYTASDPARREKLFELVRKTELNAVVIDLKDDYGGLSYVPEDQALLPYVSQKVTIGDVDGMLKKLHENNVYVIGRLFVFQDRAYVDAHPELAVQKKTGGIWRDRKGISWLDAASEDVWKYAARIAKDAYARGFDEVQFDYIRFPSDGDMSLASYPFFDAAKESRADVMRRFFAYLDAEVRKKGIPISADLFGFAYWDRDEDLTIGQRIRDAAPYFDALSPMAYPSHYPKGTLNFANPAEHPYEIVAETLRRGKEIMKEFPEVTWQSRPWIQDFDIGAIYGPKEVRAQMKATEDQGGTGWLIWNARNVYTEDAFGEEKLQ